MKLNAKKNRMLEVIMSIHDEQLLDENNNQVNDLIEQYNTSVEEDFDLEKIANEQNYNGTDLQQIQLLSNEMNIKASLEDLLKMV